MPPLFFNTNTNALIAKSIGNNQLVLTECCCPTIIIIGCVDCNFDTLAVTFSGFGHTSAHFSWCNVVNGGTFYLRKDSQEIVNDQSSDSCYWTYQMPCGPLLQLSITGNQAIGFTIGGDVLSITKKLTDAKITPSVSTCAYSLPKQGLPAATTPPYEDFTREGDCYTNGTITIGQGYNDSINPEMRCSAGIITVSVAGFSGFSVITNGQQPSFPAAPGPIFYKNDFTFYQYAAQDTVKPINGSYACFSTTGELPAILGLEKTDDQNSTANILEKVNHAPTDILLQTANYAENISGQVVGTFSTIDGGIYDIQYRGFYNNNTTYTDGDVVYTYIGSGIRYRYIDPINNSAGNSPPSDKWVVVPTINSSACTYTLVAGSGDDDNGSFTISADQLISNIPFNYEVKNSYKIRIRSTDNGFYESGADRLYLEKTFTIPVYNTNETPTEILLTGINATTPSTVLSVLENVPGGVLIGTFSMSDPDSPPNLPALPIQSRIQYLGVDYAQTGGTNGSDIQSFNFSSRDSQDRLELRTNAIFNRETKSSYTLAFRAYDAGSLSSPVKIFTINILDNNEAPINITLNHDYLWDPTNTRYEIAEFPNCLAQSASRIAVASITVSDPDGDWPIGNIFGDSNVVTLSNNNQFELLPGSMILYIKQGVNLSYDSWPPYGVISTDVIVTDSSIVPQNQQTVTCNVHILSKPLAATGLALDVVTNTIDKDTPCIQPIPSPNPDVRCLLLATISHNAIRPGADVVISNSNSSIFTLSGGELFLKGIVIDGLPQKQNLAPGDYTTTISRYDPDAICSPGRPNITLSTTFVLHVVDNHICCGNNSYAYDARATPIPFKTGTVYENTGDYGGPIVTTNSDTTIGAILTCVPGCNITFGGNAIFDTSISGGSISDIQIVKHGSGYAQICHTEPISANLDIVVAGAGTNLDLQFTFKNNPVQDPDDCTDYWETVFPCEECNDTWSVKRDATTSGVSVINGGTGYAQNQVVRINSGTNTAVVYPIVGSIDVTHVVPEISVYVTARSGTTATGTASFQGLTPQVLPNNTNVRFWEISSASLTSNNGTQDFYHKKLISITLLNGTNQASGYAFTGYINIALAPPILQIRNSFGIGASFIVNSTLDEPSGTYTITSIDVSSPGSGYDDINEWSIQNQLYFTCNNMEVGDLLNYSFSLNENGGFESFSISEPLEILCVGPIAGVVVTNGGSYYKSTSIVQWVNITQIGALYSFGATGSLTTKAEIIGNCADPCASTAPNVEAIVDLNINSPTYGGIIGVDIINAGNHLKSSSGYDWIAGIQLPETGYGSYIYLSPQNRSGGTPSNFPRNCPPGSWPTIPVWHVIQRVIGGGESFDHIDGSSSPYDQMTGHDIQNMYNAYDLHPCGGGSLGLNASGIYYINTGISIGMSWSGS